MLISAVSLAFAGLLAGVNADVHQLIIGSFGTKFLYTLEFDDSVLTLELIRNQSTPASSSWLDLSHDKKTLYGNQYGATTPSFISYALNNATDFTESGSLPLGGNCTANAIYVVAATKAPYAVYGSPFGNGQNCGVVMSVDETGALSSVLQNYTYGSTSSVHGMAITSDNTLIYSADDAGNTIWTHSMDATTGELTEVASLAGPVAGSDPRHVAVHSTGNYIYVVLEGANELAQYTINQTTGAPYFENVTFPLIGSNETSTSFWSDEVAVSFSGGYLWATSRSRATTSPGYISAFSLATTGAITAQLFLTPTSSTGGAANSVSPSEFSDRYVAVTDSSVGFVEIWELADDGSAASVIAHLDLVDGSCCANAVWYS